MADPISVEAGLRVAKLLHADGDHAKAAVVESLCAALFNTSDTVRVPRAEISTLAERDDSIGDDAKRWLSASTIPDVGEGK